MASGESVVASGRDAAVLASVVFAVVSAAAATCGEGVMAEKPCPLFRGEDR